MVFDDCRETNTGDDEGARSLAITNDLEDAYEWGSIVTTFDESGNVLTREFGYDGFIGLEPDVVLEELTRVGAPEWDFG